jgi:phosphoglycolate phosphatase-like HAD superfamily hydrolase
MGAGARPLAVFDLDGTLSDTRHRLHHLERRPKDWDAFFDEAGDDPPLPTGIALALQSAQDCDLAYVTGRPERCRPATLAWLAAQGLPDGELHMRRVRDRRPARVAKVGVMRTLARTRVIAVCEAYTREGWPVLRADWQETAPLLEQAQETEGRT